MKKVLAVIGSPRKRGNSYAVTRIIEDRLKEFGDVEFEYLFLGDANLKKCLGCEACVAHGEDDCPLNDDRSAIGQKMAEADGVVFVTPIYNSFITALMKEFIDRFTYVVHRPRFFGKPALIVVLRGNLFRQAPKYLSGVVSRWGFSVVGRLGMFELPKDEAGLAKATQRIRGAAEDFHRYLAGRRLPTPGLSELFWFRMWQVSSQMMPVDKAYWKEHGWYGRSYYYPTRIRPLGNALAALGGLITKAMLRRVFKDSKFDY